MDTISIEVPREVLHATRMTVEELRRELALYLFQSIINETLYYQVLKDQGEV